MRKIFLCFLLNFFISAAFANSTQYIIDTDMGFDDWAAVVYLLKQPVTIDAITVDCQGETHCPMGAYNAERLTHLMHRDVPVAYGQSRPLSQYDFPAAIRNFATAMSVVGFNNLKEDRDLVSISASQMIYQSIIHAAKKHKRVSIISIGTATNIADAWEIAENKHQTKLFRLGLEMIYKGGAAFGRIENNHITNIDVPGNIAIPGMMKSNDKTAEWNIYANAPAVKILIDAHLPITFIPDNATDAVHMTKYAYRALLKKPDPAREFIASALHQTIMMQGGWRLASPILDFWDTSTTIAALHPSIVSEKFSHVPVMINTTPGKHYAQISVNATSPYDVTVYYRINKDKFYRKLLAAL